MPLSINYLKRAPARALVRAMRMCPAETGWVDENVCAVNLGIVNCFLYQKDGVTICFDSGFGRAALRRELMRLNIEPGRVSHVFLTHSDFDHAGGLAVFSDAAVYLSEDEEALIGRKSRPRRFKVYHNPKIRRAYELLGDGDTVRAGSVTVKAFKTPGHTSGSMSYFVDDRVLFTGDTLSLRAGKVVPNRYFSMDFQTLRASVRTLSCLEGVELLVTAHGGCTRDFAGAMDGHGGRGRKTGGRMIEGRA